MNVVGLDFVGVFVEFDVVECEIVCLIDNLVSIFIVEVVVMVDIVEIFCLEGEVWCGYESGVEDVFSFVEVIGFEFYF